MRIKRDKEGDKLQSPGNRQADNDCLAGHQYRCQIVKPLVVIMSYFLLLTSTAASGCYVRSYQGSIICQLCFNADNTFRSCNLINAANSYTQTTCRNTCCGLQYSEPLPDTCYPTSSRSMASENSGSSVSVATILIIVFFSIPLIICFIAVIHSCITNRNRTPAMARARDDPPPSVVNLADYNMDDSFPYHIDTKQSCSICLQQNCNIITLCGHPYHSPCLTAWVKKKHNCPLCVTREFNPITIYCSKCFRAVKMSLLYKRMKDEEMKAWVVQSELSCESCRGAIAPGEVQLDMNQQQIERYQSWIKPQKENKIIPSVIKSSESLPGSLNRIINQT